jgi:2-methylcitrate dehydratase
MAKVEQLAKFVVDAAYDALSESVRLQLRIRILDSLACAIGSVSAEPVRRIREQIDDFGGRPHCTLIGGGRTAPDRATLFNGALVRYLDFNDSYLAKGETCHPSDNFAPVLAAAEYAGGHGRDLLTALAVAYQVQCRLSEVAPVRAKGFDHTTQGSYAVAAGVSRALGLDQKRTANAIAISGTAFNALRVTRTGALSHWKGLAYPNTAFCCLHASFLAKRGITGPLEVLEGNKGFMESIAGPFEIDWQAEGLDRVPRTIVKKYNAEIHSQSAIEGLLELKHDHHFGASDVEGVEVEIFDVAYDIIGGGEEGEKAAIRTKEDADHSLRYILAVALLDDQVMPEQYTPTRIASQDVQDLLQRVSIRPQASLSRRFPNEMPCRLTVHLRDGRCVKKQKSDYDGFHTRPATWDLVQRKFEQLSNPYASLRLQREIVDRVAEIENTRISELSALLARVGVPKRVAA